MNMIKLRDKWLIIKNEQSIKDHSLSQISSTFFKSFVIRRIFDIMCDLIEHRFVVMWITVLLFVTNSSMLRYINTVCVNLKLCIKVLCLQRKLFVHGKIHKKTLTIFDAFAVPFQSRKAAETHTANKQFSTLRSLLKAWNG